MTQALDLLRGVEKPGRYIGGEVNQVKKDSRAVRTRVGLSYPDVYEIGMSHIGLKILYRILNDRPEIAAERVYAPWPDFESRLRRSRTPLSTLESGIPLHALDVLGFTLQYELSYTNLVNILDLGGIPVRARDRTLAHPVVIGGGPCAMNPEPLAEIMDAVVLGDAEELILEVVDAVQASRDAGESRQDLWIRLAQLQGVYVPGLYQVEYHDDGRVRAIIPTHGAPARVRKRVVTNLDAAPYFTADLVPNIGIVHDRYGVEVQRGCMRGCRFCQAGYIYRPERQRSPETVRKLVREGLAATGSGEYSLLSLSLGDYNCIEPLLLSLMDEHENRKAAISTPSMRLESVTPKVMDQISRVRKTSFTVAPEGGSNRIRAVINKVIDEDVLVEMAAQLMQRGWKGLKLYFMLGLPTETEDDIRAIIDLASRTRKAGLPYNSSPSITVNVSSFVPKSHTPFQWCPQITLEEIQQKQALLLREAKKAKLNLRIHEATSTVMEGVLSRGDRRAGEALIRAHALGARMDGWQEHHDLAIWDQALAETGLDRAWYNLRRRDPEEVLPWDHIDPGVQKSFLWEDWNRALDEGGIHDCSEGRCYDCGVCDHRVVHNVVYPEDAPGAKPKHRAKRKHIARSMAELVQLRRGRSDASVPELTPEPAPPPPVPRDDIMDGTLPRELRTRFRVRFAKRGLAAVTSHLEVFEAFLRAMRRQEVPVIFSLAMHSRVRASMSPPIPVGAFSEAELFDVEVKRPFSAKRLREVLTHQLPEGLVVLDVEELPLEAAAVSGAIETITWRLVPPAGTALDLEALDLRATRSRADGTQVVSKRKGRKPRSLELSSLIAGLELSSDGVTVELFTAQGGRVREVFSTLLGLDPFEAGWSVTKLRVSFPEAAPPEPSAAVDGAILARSSSLRTAAPSLRLQADGTLSG